MLLLIIYLLSTELHEREIERDNYTKSSMYRERSAGTG